ncbi:MAG: formyl-CoA transferase [Pseudomonadota bacterium]|jgi:formyl-CoA transferase|nr:formyl-CoA transferase [Pseudomonadota bacterium]MDQ1308900.1 formyl-CoA transferase [Pseudomonadota bacterium]MDQ1343116.1 formyl-CoA transferase [Pseudomonadota bacterium]
MTSPTSFKPGPLAGLRVLELGTLLAGPFCGQLLGDFGAEVIKIEPPGQGDPMRVWGREKAHGKSLWWPVVARNKKAITLDLRQADGQALLRDLVKQSDFLLENFRPGTMEKWGLGWSELSAINPRLIMIRVSGFGQTGPYSRQAGFGAIGEAMGGLRYVVGDPSTPPSRMGISIGDSLAATFACIGALSALHHRDKTGRGQVVDSAIYEAVLNMMESLVTEYDKAGYVRERTGAILPNVAPSNVYRTADGMVLIAANQDTVFSRLAEAMGQPDLATNPRYSTHAARGMHQAELDALVEAWTSTLTTRAVLDAMDKYGVPAGLIYRAPDMLEDPHFKARDAIVSVPHPDFGELRMQNVAPKLSETPGAVRSPSPALGQHNDEVYLRVLGLSPERYAELKAAKVV